MYYLDYRNGALSGAAIKAAGYGGTIRYIDDLTNRSLLNDKHISLAEYKDHLAHGLKVHLVMEVNTGDANGGFARGQEYARRAKRGADVLGYKGVIFFCNDTPEVNALAWKNYLDGAASVLTWDRVGAYGFANAMDIAHSKTPCKYFWEAGRRSDADARHFLNFWQDNNTTVKVAGRTCDRNLVLVPMAGGDDLTPEESRMLKELHALYRKGNPTPGVKQTAGELTMVIIEMLTRSRRLEAAVAGLTAALASQTDLTAEEISAAVKEGLKDVVVDVDVNVNHVLDGQA